MTNSGPLLMFDVNSYEKIAEFALEQPEEQSAVCIAISDDDKIIAGGYNNRKVVFWNSESKQKIFEQEIHDGDIYALCFYENSRKLASGSLDKTIKLWDVGSDFQSLNLNTTLSGHSDFVLTLAVDKTNRWLLSGSKDKTIRLTDLTAQEMIYSLVIHTNSVITVDFCPTAEQFCSGSGDKSIKIWSYAEN